MLLKSRFLALKKVVQVVQIGGREGGWSFGQNLKEQQLFFAKPSLTWWKKQLQHTPMDDPVTSHIMAFELKMCVWQRISFIAIVYILTKD